MEKFSHYENIFESKNYFEKANLVILAEDIGHGKHTQMILDFLDQFGDQIKGVFVEHPIDLQNSINTYIQMGEVDMHLERLFAGALREGKDIKEGVLSVFDKAKALGIRVICYDASKAASDERHKKSQEGYYFLKGECRDEDMFENIKVEYENNPGKYVIVVGSNHMSVRKRAGDFDNFGQRMKEEFKDNCVSVRMTNSHRLNEDPGGYYDDVVGV